MAPPAGPAPARDARTARFGRCPGSTAADRPIRDRGGRRGAYRRPGAGGDARDAPPAAVAARAWRSGKPGRAGASPRLDRPGPWPDRDPAGPDRARPRAGGLMSARLVLASTSPYPRELRARLGLALAAARSAVDSIPTPESPPAVLPRR